MTRFLSENNVFYHGTYNEFSRFRPLSHFGSIYAAKAVLNQKVKKTELIDINNIIGSLSYGLTFSEEQTPHIIPVKLNLQNTYEMQDVEASHERSFFSDLLLFHFIKDLKRKLLSARYDYIVKEPFGKTPLIDVQKELESDSLYVYNQDGKYETEKLNRYHLFLQRMIHYFESIGFDGFHYTNHYEDAGHISYVPFRPESIIRLDTAVGESDNSKVIKNDNILALSGERDLSNDEQCTLRFEKIYRMEGSAEKMFLLSLNKKALLRPSSFRQIMKEKAYYSKVLFSEVMPKIERITNQSRYGYHGLSHTQQVGLFGIELALSVHQDPLPVILAAGLHDCARVNDEYCEQHGPRCEPIARKFLADNYPDLLPVDVERIVKAVKEHTVGRNSSDLVSACLWDADRVRLSWEMGFAPEFFSTPYGKKLGALTRSKQEKYIADQEKFLIENGIKTRAQIEYDKMMDVKQNLIGTNFKVR